MVLKFSEIPIESRLWIFQSNRVFSDLELKEIEESLNIFLRNWTAHGKKLISGFKINYKRFITIAIDESSHSATGCSIDSCVHFIQSLEKKYKVDLLDKMNITFKQGDYISYKSIDEFKKMIKNKSVSKKTIVFNNMVVNIADFLENWEVPAYKSWHNRYFK
tara:strand:+ start:606 stop:1091 length:486 start_codon:yes stop_codon:yes gene_type:complete